LRFFDHLALSTGGCAINCSLALAKLGVPCDTIARVGTDLLGDFVVAELARHGIATDGIVRDASVSTRSPSRASLRPASAASCIRRERTAGCARRMSRRSGCAAASSCLSPDDVMDALDGEPTAQVLAAARAAGARTLLDTVYVEATPRAEWQRRVLPALAHVDYFVPSHARRRRSPAWRTRRRSPAPSGRRARNVVIKLGAQGTFCRSADAWSGTCRRFTCRRSWTRRSRRLLECRVPGWPARESVNGRGRRLGNAVAAHAIQAAVLPAGVASLDVIRQFIARVHQPGSKRDQPPHPRR